MRRRARRWPRPAVAVLCLLAVACVATLADEPAPGGPGATTSAPAPTTAAAPPTTSRPDDGGTEPAGPADPAGALVDTLRIAEPAPDLPPYRRDAFGSGWAYDPASGCNTRERVLIEEALVPPIVDDRCRSTAGRWRSAYDGIEVTDVAELEIDHLVPLAEAWRSGAATWTPEQRAAFHDDLANPETLIAVTSRTNRSKGDSRPDQWLPPDRNAWCTYATDWVSVKATWGLTVTPAEKATLVSVLSGC